MKGFKLVEHRSHGEVLTDMLNPLAGLTLCLLGIGEQLPARFCQSLGIPGFDEGTDPLLSQKREDFSSTGRNRRNSPRQTLEKMQT